MSRGLVGGGVFVWKRRRNRVVFIKVKNGWVNFIFVFMFIFRFIVFKYKGFLGVRRVLGGYSRVFISSVGSRFINKGVVFE